MVRLDSFIAKADYGSIAGSAVLKSLQNGSMPTLDLLVREAIQNSLDAAQQNPEAFCRVRFQTGHFDKKLLNPLFDGIDSVLSEKYGSEGQADYLEIRDLKTSGLNGPVEKKYLARKDHGNFLKLIFDTGKQQNDSEGGTAGGSWGYGKSVYYRVGMGLVIFYTHIKNELGHYESRLIASLIENEESDDTLLKRMEQKQKQPDETIGRAWWGIMTPAKDEILPVTNDDVIREILDIFDLKPFRNNETGTSIIIPYINKQALLKEVIPSGTNLNADQIELCTFKNTLEDYLKFAIQKWYAPKIQNKALKDIGSGVEGRHIKWLDARINGVSILPAQMYKPFLLARELYTVALAKGLKVPYSSTDDFRGIKAEIITLRNSLKDSTAGCVSFIRISKRKLFSDNSKIPLSAYLGKFGDGTDSSAIFMFARLPGMILDYKVADRWTAGLPVTGKDEYLFVFFVPKSSNQLKKPITANGKIVATLGEYLRNCEKSDHQDWNDFADQTIVERLQRNIGSKVTGLFKKNKIHTDEAEYTTLSKSVGAALLPTKTQRGGGSGGSSGGGGGSSRATVSVTLGKVSFTPEGVNIPFAISFDAIKKKATIGILVETEHGQWTDKKWNKDMDKPFPFGIVKLSHLTAISGLGGKEYPFTSDATREHRVSECDISKVEIIGQKRNDGRADSYEDFSRFMIINAERREKITGVVVLRALDRKFSCTIREIKEV